MVEDLALLAFCCSFSHPRFSSSTSSAVAQPQRRHTGRWLSRRTIGCIRRRHPLYWRCRLLLPRFPAMLAVVLEQLQGTPRSAVDKARSPDGHTAPHYAAAGAHPESNRQSDGATGAGTKGVIPRLARTSAESNHRPYRPLRPHGRARVEEVALPASFAALDACAPSLGRGRPQIQESTGIGR
jgi:hypothetical protein